MEPVQYQPIGRILSPFENRTGVPRQAAGALDTRARIEIFDDYAEGLRDVEGFSHLVVVFHFHWVTRSSLVAHPPWDGKEHGVFATRSPYRPNPIGLSIVRLERIQANVLHIAGVDMINGTPVLDIKPYVPELNPSGTIERGWLAHGKAEGMIRSHSGDR